MAEVVAHHHFMRPPNLVIIALAGIAAAASIPSRRQYPLQEHRELRDINFVHTSDIHSWYRGHRKDDDLSKTWRTNMGEVVSFVLRMKERAEAEGKDVIFVDSGDETRGGGLSDADEPEGSKALAIQANLPYDLMSPGNHELEFRNITKSYYRMWKNMPRVAARKILGSNIDYEDDSVNPSVNASLGNRYLLFETRNHRKVAALGVSFENPKTRKSRTFIQPVEEMTKEPWFNHEFLNPVGQPDIFVLFGHMSVSDVESKWGLIQDAIRKKYPTTPIVILGGHTHRRDCKMDFDDVGRTIAVESGRFLETLGWVGVTLGREVSFIRRYLDPSRETFLRHTDLSDASFDTKEGKKATAAFDELAGKLGLSERCGCAPTSYAFDLKPFKRDDPEHVMNLYLDKAFPKVVATPNQPYYLLMNNGFMRGPIHQGEFTKDDALANIPYPQRFSALQAPKVIAEEVVQLIAGSVDPDSIIDDEQWLGDMEQQQILPAGLKLTPGYITKDHLGVGDDVLHAKPGLSASYPPKYNHARSPSADILDPLTNVDLITIPYLEVTVYKAIIAAIQAYNLRCKESMDCKELPAVEDKWRVYGTVDSRDVIPLYARKQWLCKLV